MKSEIIELIRHANYSAEFIAYVEKEFPEDYSEKFKQPYHKKVEDNPLLGLSPKERLFSSLVELLNVKNYYHNKQIPIQYLYDSISDLSFRLERFHANNNIYGLSERDLRWLAPLFKAEIVDLGSLRFQRIWFSFKGIEREGYDFMPLSDKWKKRFPEGTPVIEIHIQTDTDFRKDKIDEAFALARNFFERYFSEHEYEIFICRTWLLYPKTRDILSEDSNIASFSKRFEVIASHQNTKQALDRIYGTNDLEEIASMEKDSSLARVAWRNLDKLGVAAGIIYK